MQDTGWCGVGVERIRVRAVAKPHEYMSSMTSLSRVD